MWWCSETQGLHPHGRTLRRARKNLSSSDADRACLISSYGWNQIETGAARSRLREGSTRNRAWSRACARRESSALERSNGCTTSCSELRTPRRTVAATSTRRSAAPSSDDLCNQAADDAVVAVTAKLDGYRGASRFTTWAYAFVVFEISVKLRRHAWRRGRIPTADDDATWDRLAEGSGAAQSRAESADLLRALRGAVDEELTPRQRQVFVAVALNDVEIDVVAGELQSSCGAVYSALHDARTKLRRRLEHEGHLEQEGAR